MYYTDEELPTVVTFEETRKYLFIGRNTLLDLLHSGKLKGKKIGNKWRIKKKILLSSQAKATSMMNKERES